MALFERLYSQGHEEVVYFSDPTCNLKVIVAIHNTILGPALGGTRMCLIQVKKMPLKMFSDYQRA